ncbi:DNA methyltransferase [Chitiniphilus eburneus]|uniref:DNA methyltransferase n=1 Tax=Chitiniphilus eburneus TaxID=2571148 RepID=UPI0035CFE2B6
MGARDPYLDFLRQKIKLAEFTGFDIEPDEINPLLLPHHRAIVLWAVRGGCRAVFAAFGLGKTVIQIEIVRLIVKYAGGAGLIVLPLGVRQEFARDARMLATGDHPKITDAQRAELKAWRAGQGQHATVEFTFIRSPAEVRPGQQFYLTNYETVRDGKLDPNLFAAVSLDEASVLRSFGSKTYQTFLSLFDRVRFKFVCTATPSPNRYKELIHYAGFLGVMDTGQALTRFFQRDSTKANNLTLYPHKEDEFWLWVSSWACFIQRPSDLGFSDAGYDLPPLKLHLHEVPAVATAADATRDGQVFLFRDAALGLQAASAEKRASLDVRVAKVAEIVATAPDEHWLIWHDLEDERHAIQQAVPGVTSVWGSQDLEVREQAIIDFSEGRLQHLSTKPIIAGSGCNFQRHCRRAVFAGIGYKFNDFIQAIHRIYRFLQEGECEIHLVFSEAEREVLRELMAKWEQHKGMVRKMTDIIKKYGLDQIAMAEILARTIGVERVEIAGDRYTIANNDAVLEARLQPENSVDLIVTSIPFANHYEYTPSYNDFGHTEDNAQFWAQMDFLSPELLRILQPGRLACIHVKDRILFGNVTGQGVPTVSPFHCEAIQHYISHGFQYMGMITVVTDVVRENNQTYRLGWSEQCKDGSKMGVGSPEYILLMRKPQSNLGKSYADVPVVKSKADYTRARWQVDAHAFWRSSGDRHLTPEELAVLGPDKLAKAFTEYSLEHIYDYQHHVRIGEALEARGSLPSSFMSLAPGSHHAEVWHDINRMRTLNGEQTQRGLQNHVCPLQFDIVDRLINRYSNPDELVYEPFGGLMTVVVRALKLGRLGRASELNHAYFLDGAGYCAAAEMEASMPTLFDLIPEKNKEAA